MAISRWLLSHCFFYGTIYSIADNFILTTSQPSQVIKPIVVEKLPNIAAMHLFGEYKPTMLDPSSLPETTLNLTLIGTFMAIPEKLSEADIRANGEETVYAMGDALPGGATITKILPDSVVLQHNGRLEYCRYLRMGLTWVNCPRG